MTRRLGTLLFVALPLLGCAVAHDVDGAGGSTTSGAVVNAKQELACEHDGVDSLTGLPDHLECTGLYADIVSKTPAEGVEPYSPAVWLWSDGADKHRWISLPEGTKIDASSPNDWVFPVGTKLFKEFAVAGHRIETRLFEKQSDRWVRTTYAWNADETSATRSDGGDITIAGGQPYHLPTAKECDECHQGRKDRALGFEQILLGLDGATGMNLAKLAQKKLIEPVPAQLNLQVADDGTGNAVEVLSWMHVNCGVSCHNANPNAAGHSTKLHLKLDVDQLDGSSATEYETLTTTINVAATTPRWGGKIRIVPGSPENSLLYQLASNRGGGENDQMPPIATTIVDPTIISKLATWIRSLPTQ